MPAILQYGREDLCHIYGLGFNVCFEEDLPNGCNHTLLLGKPLDFLADAERLCCDHSQIGILVEQQ